MKKEIFHARTHDDLREDVSAYLMAVSASAKVSEIAAVRAGAAGRAMFARHSARSHSSECLPSEAAHTDRDLDRSRYASHTAAPVQGYEVYQHQTVCIRAGTGERSGKVVRRMDTSTGSIVSCVYANKGRDVSITGDGFIRGGNWDNGANDGAFTLNLNNAPSNVNTNIGFRCARYAPSAGADGQNKSSTEPSQKSHRSILTHPFFQAHGAWRRISDLYIRFVLVAGRLAKAQGGVSGSRQLV